MAKQLSAADTLRRYQGRVARSKKWRKAEKYDELWERCLDSYRNRPYKQADDNEDRISVAFGFSTVNIVFPSVSINYPKITIEAQNPGDADKAVIAEAVIRYQLRHCGIKPQARKVVKDSLIFGHGWGKIGWRLRHAMKPVDPHARASQVQDLQDQANQFAQDNPDAAGSLPTEEDIDEGVPFEELVTLEDGPYFQRIDPFDIFIDPDATCIEDLRWIAQRIVKPFEEVKNDPRYDVTARNKVESDSTWSSEWLPEGKKLKDYGDDVNRVTLYEFYDIAKKQMCVFAEHGSGFLVKPVDIPYDYGHPFIFLGDYEVPGQFYPMGELEAIESLMDELNKTRSQLMNARQQFVPKYLYSDNAFDDDGRAALESQTPNTMVPVRGDNVRLTEAVIPMPTQNLNPELFRYSESIEQDLDLVSGVTEFQRGNAVNIRRTATEVSQIQDAANARARDKQAQIEEFYRVVGERLLQLNQQYLTGKQAARITRDDGAAVWFTYKNGDIQGQFDFSVESGSTAPHNEAYRKQQAHEFLQTFGPFFNRLIDPQAAVMWAMQQMDIPHPEKFMLPPDAYRIFPTEKLIETMNYQDLPTDVKRQMEQIAGFKPSQLPPRDNQPSTAEKIIETLDYKDLPPDVQRQVEAQAGFQPSTVNGGMVQMTNGALPAGPDGAPLPGSMPHAAPGHPDRPLSPQEFAQAMHSGQPIPGMPPVQPGQQGPPPQGIPPQIAALMAQQGGPPQGPPPGMPPGPPQQQGGVVSQGHLVPSPGSPASPLPAGAPPPDPNPAPQQGAPQGPPPGPGDQGLPPGMPPQLLQMIAAKLGAGQQDVPHAPSGVEHVNDRVAVRAPAHARKRRGNPADLMPPTTP